MNKSLSTLISMQLTLDYSECRYSLILAHIVLIPFLLSSIVFLPQIVTNTQKVRTETGRKGDFTINLLFYF